MYSNLIVFLLVSSIYAHENNSIADSTITPSTSYSTSTTKLPIINSSTTTITTTATTTSTSAATASIPIITTSTATTENPVIVCTCGVFLSGQFKKGSKAQPTGNAALLHEQSETFPCSHVGNKMCTNKCLDVIVKHLPNSSNILCGSIDRDCLKERAYLFVKNCKDEWTNTNLSAGREYCCKNGEPYKCPS